MDLPEGFHQEVIEARENNPYSTSDFSTLVSTNPLKSGGASFKTNVLIKASSFKYVYKPSISVALFCSLFLCIGLGVLFFATYPFKINDFIDVSWTLLLVGLVFSTVSSFMFYNFYKPRVFDKQSGFYYSTYKFRLHKTKRPSEINKYIPLKSIKALQIIGEHVSSDNGSYKSFELNLVLENNTRKNVVDHGNLKSIINDAHALSEFLSVPIWHAKSSN